jgi:hypothetical protein
MKVQVQQFKAPPSKTMEQIYEKYLQKCLMGETRLKSIVVNEPSINWRAVVMSLPEDQRSRVLGCGIRQISLREYECVYDGIYRFHVERLDGTDESFDWRDAYRNAYHTYFDKSFKDDVETALRSSVLHHLVEYKENQSELVSHISGQLLTWEKAVVQHHPTPFKELVHAFLNEVDLKIEQCFLEYDDQHVYTFKDKALLQRWQMFHLLRAHYRIVSVDEAMIEPDL